MNELMNDQRRPDEKNEETDSQTDSQIDRQRQTDTDTHGHTDSQTNRHTGKQDNKSVPRKIDRSTGKHSSHTDLQVILPDVLSRRCDMEVIKLHRITLQQSPSDCNSVSRSKRCSFTLAFARWRSKNAAMVFEQPRTCVKYKYADGSRLSHSAYLRLECEACMAEILLLLLPYVRVARR